MRSTHARKSGNGGMKQQVNRLGIGARSCHWWGYNWCVWEWTNRNNFIMANQLPRLNCSSINSLITSNWPFLSFLMTWVLLELITIHRFYCMGIYFPRNLEWDQETHLKLCWEHVHKNNLQSSFQFHPPNKSKRILLGKVSLYTYSLNCVSLYSISLW